MLKMEKGFQGFCHKYKPLVIKELSVRCATFWNNNFLKPPLKSHLLDKDTKKTTLSSARRFTICNLFPVKMITCFSSTTFNPKNLNFQYMFMFMFKPFIFKRSGSILFSNTFSQASLILTLSFAKKSSTRQHFVANCLNHYFLPTSSHHWTRNKVTLIFRWLFNHLGHTQNA